MPFSACCVLSCEGQWPSFATEHKRPGIYICGELCNAVEGKGPTGHAAVLKLDPGHTCLWSGQMKNVGDLCFHQLLSLDLEQWTWCFVSESSRWHYVWDVWVLKLSTRSEIALSLQDAELQNQQPINCIKPFYPKHFQAHLFQASDVISCSTAVTFLA